MAQQSGDKACVAQAMGWLHQVLAAQGHPRAGDVLRRWGNHRATREIGEREEERKGVAGRLSWYLRGWVIFSIPPPVFVVFCCVTRLFFVFFVRGVRPWREFVCSLRVLEGRGLQARAFEHFAASAGLAHAQFCTFCSLVRKARVCIPVADILGVIFEGDLAKDTGVLPGCRLRMLGPHLQLLLIGFSSPPPPLFPRSTGANVSAAAAATAATFRCAIQAADLNLHQLMHSATLLLAKEAAVAKHGNPTHGNSSSGNGGDGGNSSSTSVAASSMGAGGRRKRPSPTRVWECLAAVDSGDLRGLLESEAATVGAGSLNGMATSGAGGGARPAVELRGGTGGEVAAGLSCQRLLVEAGAFERFGYSDMAVACARSILQVRFWRRLLV